MTSEGKALSGPKDYGPWKFSRQSGSRRSVTTEAIISVLLRFYYGFIRTLISIVSCDFFYVNENLWSLFSLFIDILLIFFPLSGNQSVFKIPRIFCYLCFTSFTQKNNQRILRIFETNTHLPLCTVWPQAFILETLLNNAMQIKHSTYLETRRKISVCVVHSISFSVYLQ